MAATAKPSRLDAMIELRSRGKLPPEMEPHIAQEVMAGLDPGARARVRAVLDGRSILSSREKSSKYGEKLYGAVNMINPQYDEIQAGVAQKAKLDYANPSPTKPGGNMIAASTAMEHMGQLRQLIPQVAGHSLPLVGHAVNAMENGYNELSGDSGITRYNQTAGTAGSELTRYYRQAGGSESDIQRELKDFNPNGSDEQKYGAVNNGTKLLGSRLHSLIAQYQASTGSKGYPPNLSPAAQKLYEAYSKSADKPGASATTKGPDMSGVKIERLP